MVGVATPNHWHALATIWACQAGKDVYVEKPGSHNIYEGRKMVEAAKKHGRIVQHGVQLRSSEAMREAVDHMRNGLIGNVYMARGLVFRDRASIGHFKDPDTAPSTLTGTSGKAPRPSVRSRSGSSTTTGTGTGPMATATSATRGSTKPTCASGAWVSRRSRAGHRDGGQVPLGR